MSDEPEARASRRVGVIGAGQLARMMGEAAATSHVTLSVLATSFDESAVETVDEVVIGDPNDANDLLAFANDVDVVTFDHELVDLSLLEELEGRGVTVRPSAAALRFAVDKAYQRATFAAAGLPVPKFVIVRRDADVSEDLLDGFADAVVVKLARGGYDGRGVFFPDSAREASETIAALHLLGDVVIEERVELRSEVAQIVVRDARGLTARFPVVTTVQRDGMCVEVRYPSELSAELVAQADELSERVAQVVKPIGVLAVEYFETDQGLVVNEVALRPHNSGHWTIEGCATSQFAEHLLAVSGQTLGPMTPSAERVVMVNVVGSKEPADSARVATATDLFVHDYGKSWRPGRKLGHVTALGSDAHEVHVRAWQGARAYGTGARED